jgi:hypothetical protein
MRAQAAKPGLKDGQRAAQRRRRFAEMLKPLVGSMGGMGFT